MAEAFKHLLGPRQVSAAARHLARAAPNFPHARFEALALEGLEEREFKARAEHVADALEATLPTPFPRAAALIERALAPAGDPAAEAPPPASDAGLSGWIVWPLGEFVARRGLGEPDRALATLHALTQRFSAEWAIRPFLEQHPELTLRRLAEWARDPSAHVRRLVSEGSRPRLPWGRQLRALVQDPTPTLPLLRALQDDPSEYVRRSVANHLNDIAKDHPGLVAEWLEEHLPGAGEPRRALLRHAARTLVKAGDRRVLAAFGLGARWVGRAELQCSPRRIALGEAVTLRVVLTSTARRAQDLAIDYVVHHVKANGETSPKVFKGWVKSLAPGATLTLEKRHAVRPITTRRYFAGRHRVELQVNGAAVAEGAFDLAAPR